MIICLKDAAGKLIPEPGEIFCRQDISWTEGEKADIIKKVMISGLLAHGAFLMIQCKDCEYFERGPGGELSFKCDPFTSIKEPECLAKWQLIKINQLTSAYQSTLDYYRKLAPLQEKMFKVMQRELEDIDEQEKWKIDEDADEDKQDQML